ncbi:unnamed protein product [Dicrocoelium dendriticum]|nr:unnamed protein product [Dicrocoelium dendriticum]
MCSLDKAVSLTPAERRERLEKIKAAIICIPDFPTPGVLFRDIFCLFRDPELMIYMVTELKQVAQECVSPDMKINAVVGPDARGFLVGPLLAMHLHCAFVPARKAGKLPGECRSVTYNLEYGTATMEIQKDAIKPNDHVLLIDDVLATGGSLKACVELIRESGAFAEAAIALVELDDLNGRAKLESVQIPVHSLIHY